MAVDAPRPDGLPRGTPRKEEDLIRERIENMREFKDERLLFRIHIYRMMRAGKIAGDALMERVGKELSVQDAFDEWVEKFKESMLSRPSETMMEELKIRPQGAGFFDRANAPPMPPGFQAKVEEIKARMQKKEQP